MNNPVIPAAPPCHSRLSLAGIHLHLHQHPERPPIVHPVAGIHPREPGTSKPTRHPHVHRPMSRPPEPLEKPTATPSTVATTPKTAPWRPHAATPPPVAQDAANPRPRRRRRRHRRDLTVTPSQDAPERGQGDESPEATDSLAAPPAPATDQLAS